MQRHPGPTRHNEDLACGIMGMSDSRTHQKRASSPMARSYVRVAWRTRRSDRGQSCALSRSWIRSSASGFDALTRRREPSAQEVNLIAPYLAHAPGTSRIP